MLPALFSPVVRSWLCHRIIRYLNLPSTQRITLSDASKCFVPAFSLFIRSCFKNP
jgi:hypothetical protein